MKQPSGPMPGKARETMSRLCANKKCRAIISDKDWPICPKCGKNQKA
jgi:hypothetical protein